MYEPIIKRQNLISLDEVSHTYTLKNSEIKFNSVTEFIGGFFQPFDEQEVAKKLTQLNKYKGQSINDILNEWEQRRNRGTIVHREIEDFIIERNANGKRDSLYNLDLKTQQAIKFLNKCNIYKNNLIFPEVRVFSEELRLAGTIDLIIYNKPKNEISIIDWKTNVEIKKRGYRNGTKSATKNIEDCSFNKYELQLSMYRYILENFYKARVAGTYILHLKDEGFQYLKCEFRSKEILSMLQER
tara:strand:- start:99 stop:824 length:726 start_codon:yes stop_codon:yes gene_type:complete